MCVVGQAELLERHTDLLAVAARTGQGQGGQRTVITVLMSAHWCQVACALAHKAAAAVHWLMRGLYEPQKVCLRSGMASYGVGRL